MFIFRQDLKIRILYTCAHNEKTYNLVKKENSTGRYKQADEETTSEMIMASTIRSGHSTPDTCPLLN